MLRPALILAGLLALTAACNSAAKQACAAKVATMRALFAQGPGEMLVINTPAGMQLPVSARGAAVDDGLPLFVHADGTFNFNNEAFATVAAVNVPLTDEFDKANQLGESMGKPWQPRLLLVADQRAPASAIVELAALVPPATRLLLIANLEGDTAPAPPPMPPAVEAALKVPADQRAYALAELLKPAIGSCAAIRETFDAVAATSSDQRSKVLFDGLPAALEKCGCDGVDVDTLFSVVWSMSGKTEPTRRQLVLPLAQDPAAETIELPTNATAAELVRLAETRDGKPFRLAPRP